MADHLDFIRIRGLESADTEVFQGLGAASLTISGGSGSGGNTAIDWGEIPQDALNMVLEYTQSLNDWIAKAVRYDPDTGSRALVPELLSDLPVVPLAIGTVATGGLSLPAVAGVMLSQVIMNQVGSAVANYASSLDENSAQNIIKKALLWDNNGTEESILKTALLRVSDDEKSILHARLMALVEELALTTEAVEDLTFVDAKVKYADNTSLHVKGKVLNH